MPVNNEKYYTPELLSRAKGGDKQATEELIRRNKPLINSLLKRFLQYSEEYDDLFQIGAIGLIKAARRYDPDYNTQFSTYAVHVINGELKRHLRDEGAVKVSRSLKTVYLKVRANIEYCIKTKGYEPGVAEISKNLGIGEDDIISAMEACRNPDHFEDSPGGDENTRTNADIIADTSDEIGYALDKIAIKASLDKMDMLSRRIIVLRYINGLTQSKTAKILGISQVQVSRKEKRIIEKLKSEYYAV